MTPPLYPLVMGRIVTLPFFKDGFGYKRTTKVDILLNQETKPNHPDHSTFKIN